ncbi:MAG: ArsC family reductase [Alphaproteobacteria bacterium]
MITIYGIKNCDTVRKARKWLEAEGIEHHFHDFRADGLDRATLEGWLKQVERDVLINRRGTTWRKLDDAQKEISSDEDAIRLLLEHVAIIKRPVFDTGGQILVGFRDEQKAALSAP